MKILGISLGHDSGASIFEDNTIKVAINEERLSRNHITKFFMVMKIF